MKKIYKNGADGKLHNTKAEKKEAKEKAAQLKKEAKEKAGKAVKKAKKRAYSKFRENGVLVKMDDVEAGIQKSNQEKENVKEMV